ncbi:MAG: hypothetical protein A2Y60_02975 [Chloroflexi bacterium RBG_13_54_9]|nr:MAG: hypothetical protein A2Y60_02975 [Chloroflexi bacterium RBG_13_54_9]
MEMVKPLGIGFALLFLVACSRVTVATPTPTPGIGVPVTGGRWQVTIANAQKTTKWEGIGHETKSGYAFLLVTVTFHNLDASLKTAVSTEGATIVTADGELKNIFGLETGDISNIESWNGAHITPESIKGIRSSGSLDTFMARKDTLSMTLVYVISTEGIDSQVFTFQFQDIQIPFTLN